MIFQFDKLIYVKQMAFAKCFPIEDGTKMMCQHFNGSWIVFPATKNTPEVVEETPTTSKEE